MSNTNHYPTHPGAEHPPIMTCEIPLEEYESLKRENAELKAKADELSFDKKLLDNHWESEKIRCEAASRDCIELSNENAKLVSKIESLKVGHRQGIANIKSYYKAKRESAQATAYTESVDAGMENRRLKRALWLARALALSRFDVEEYLRKYTHCDSRYWNDGLNSFNGACKEMQKAINIAEAKCRAKAEEYK